MSYQEFLESKCNLEGDDFEQMGYSVKSAICRYEVVGNIFRRFSIECGRPDSVLDFGAGNGMFWEYNYDLKYKEIIAVEAIDDKNYISKLKNRLAKSCSKFEVVKSIDEVNTQLDLVFAIGSLNYYPITEFFTLLDKLWDRTRHLLVIETNIQSPQTAVSPGNYNPSLQSLYEYFYDKHLQYGGRRFIDISIIKKYSAVVTVCKEVKD